MSVFARDNLLAWCIVPFDARKRGPQERAAMLQRLGIGALAYDWRDEHIERFDEELCQLRGHGVEMTAFWLSGSYPQDEQGVWEDPHLRAALEFVDRNGLKIEMWKMLVGEDLQQIADSGYDGLIGLIDHRPEIDAEFSLRENLAGMQKILAEIGDQRALATYQ